MSEQPTSLPRRFGLLPATALNMTNMMGAGPFITIPLLMTALGGPRLWSPGSARRRAHFRGGA